MLHGQGEIMLIGEFAETSGLSRETVRFYVKLGLLRPGLPASRQNRYRNYSHKDVERARLIRLGQALGFTLRELKELMRSWESKTLSDAAKIEIMRTRIDQIAIQIRDLRRVKRYFEAKTNWLASGGKDPEPQFVGLEKTNIEKRKGVRR